VSYKARWAETDTGERFADLAARRLRELAHTEGGADAGLRDGGGGKNLDNEGSAIGPRRFVVMPLQRSFSSGKPPLPWPRYAPKPMWSHRPDTGGQAEKMWSHRSSG